MKILRNLLIAFVSLGLTGGLIPLGGSSLAVAPQGLAEPLIGMLAAGGDSSFGQTATTGFTTYSAAAPGTPAYAAVQAIGRPDIVAALGGSFEGWANGSLTVTASMLSTAFGGTYLRLNGTQQPTINNGSVFSSYAMLSGDGLMLQLI